MTRILAASAPPWKWTTDEWLGFGLRIAIALVIGLLVTVIARRYVRHARRQAKEAGDEPSARKLRRQVTVASLAATTAIVIVWFVVLCSILTWMGVSIGALIASAGIAGVALGLRRADPRPRHHQRHLHPPGGPVRRGRHRRSRDRGRARLRHDRGAHVAHHLRAAVRRDAQHRPQRLDPDHQQQDARVGSRDRGRARRRGRGPRARPHRAGGPVRPNWSSRSPSSAACARTRRSSG